ncbi:MAG: NnrU family protein [Pseudomonadota bacterium]
MLLTTGLVIFLVTHLFTAYARGPRSALVARLGDGPYKGLYSLISLTGFVLLVMGWKRAVPEALYAPPSWGTMVATPLLVVAFILFTASYLPAGRIKSWAGHPMSLGAILGSFAHLLVNGDSRSVTVFGAFFLWGLADRFSYRVRGDSGAVGTSRAGDVGAIVGGLISSFVTVRFLHLYLSGVPLDPAGLICR